MVELTFCRTMNCKDFALARGYCHKHYMQQYRSPIFIPRYIIEAKECLHDGCANKIVAKGLCWKHYQKQRRGNFRRVAMEYLISNMPTLLLLYLQNHPMFRLSEPKKPKKVRRIPKPPYPGAKPCGIDGCDGYAVCRGICRRHYEHMRYHGLPLPQVVKPTQCTVEGCQGKRESRGLCQKHYTRLKRHGTTDLPKVDGRSANKRHGMAGTPEYISWSAMLQRCTNPKAKHYENYGGRGIKVCERWLHSFENFYADMGERPEGKTLHRINVDGDYEPGNCKWATSREQAIRKRLPRNNKSGYRGVHFYRGKWIASITSNDEPIYLGRFNNKEEAARMYNQAAIVHFGPEAMLNAV